MKQEWKNVPSKEPTEAITGNTVNYSMAHQT